MVNNSTCIKLKATDQELAVVHQPVLASGDVGTTRVEYELDSFWDGYALTGTFYAGRLPSEVYEQPLTDGACVIPWEVLQDPDVLWIGLRGVNSNGLVKTAAPIRYRVVKGSPCGTDTTREPTPDVYQQILGKMDTVERMVEETAASTVIACESSGEVVTIADASDQPLRGLRLYGKTTQDGTLKNAVVSMVNSVGANLIPFPYEDTYSKNGLVCTINSDKSITVNGTAESDTFFKLHEFNELAAGTYTLSGCPLKTSNNIYSLYAYIYGDKTYYYDVGEGACITLPANRRVVVNILVRQGVSVSNLTFHPMLNKGSTALPYEPYKGGTATLAQPVTLSGIPVSSGGNYTDANGQQWVCDEMDFARGIKVQRVDPVNMVSLATPVETPISETDLTAYRTLHTNKPNTTVYTDSGAGITVEYVADTKTYIDNKFAELATAILQNA